MKLVKTVKKICISCMEEHEIKVVRITERNIFKNEPIEYIAEYYYCELTDELYADEDMISKNDIRMKDAYRRKMGLLESREISDIRKKYEISQKDFCVLLGWGEKTITRYEGHQVQDKAHNSILKQLDNDPEWYIQLLIESKAALPLKTYENYYAKALLLYEENREKYLRKAIFAKYVRYVEKNDCNGKTNLSLDKTADVIRYFSNSDYVTNLYKVKLMKLLWYADFLSYKQRGCSITGLVYKALPMGAVPIAHESIIDLKGIIYDEIDVDDGIAYRFRKQEKAVYDFLCEEDKNILDMVISKFGRMSKDEIVSTMHKEKAFIETPQREIISYEYAKSLKF